VSGACDSGTLVRSTDGARSLIGLLGVALLASALVGVATLAARRWGDGVGGVLSAFPLIVGPVLLVAAERHGTAFAARTAGATLVGLVSVAAFAVTYGRSALRRGWGASLLGGWAAAVLLGLLAGRADVGLALATAVAAAAIAAAHLGLPAATTPTARLPSPRGELAARIVLTAALIVALTLAADRFGPVVAGVLSALPVLASVLAVATHRSYGRHALVDLLRGMVVGLSAFAAFCAIVGGLVDRAGVAVAFTAATAVAVGVQAAAARTRIRPLPAR
jgi:hypothetical protein